MSAYIENNLLADEKIVFFSRPHWIVFASVVWPLLFTLLIAIYGHDFLTAAIYGYSLYSIFLVIGFAVTLVQLASALILYHNSEYGVTNKRVLVKRGWIWRTSSEIFLDKIEAVKVDQTIPGRLLHYGVLIIIGTGGTQDRFTNVPHPLDFRRRIQQQIDYLEHSES